MYSAKTPKCNKKFEIVETRQHTNGFTLYKVVIKEFVSTGPLEYIKESVIWKRYNDFKNLHQQLFRLHKEIYLPGRFPAFVKPKLFGRFDSAVIQERVKCSQELLDFATQHLALYSSRWFEEFFRHSKQLEKSSELGQLKETPLAPQLKPSKEVETTRKARQSSLSDADLQLFDPCMNSETDTSDEAAKNDWLAIVHGVSKPSETRREKAETASSQQTQSSNSKDTTEASTSHLSIEDDIPNADFGDLGSLEDLRIEVTDAELAAYHSPSIGPVNSNDNNCPASVPLSCNASLPALPSVPNSVADLDDSDKSSKPNYDAFKEFTDSELNFTEGGIDWTNSSTAGSPTEQSNMYRGNGVGLAKEEHRKSSKARAYLQQILDHNNSSSHVAKSQPQDDGCIEPKRDLKNLKGSKSSKDLRELKTKSGNANFNNANDSVRRASEPGSEIKGSLLDLKRFFLDDTGDELRGLYLVDAAKYISKAQNSESAEKYQDTVTHYKSAIKILLQGVQDDTNEMRIQAVRRKTSKYLKKVEEIHDKFLKNMVNNTALWTADQTQNQFDDNDEGRERSHSNEPQDASSLEYNRISRLKDGNNRVASPRHSSKDLIGYKVLGIVGRVLLVLDTLSNNTYVIKVLQKASMRRRRLRKAVIPTNVPFMVQLYRFFSTENFIYLVLEHAAGGRLWDQLSAFVTPVRTTADRISDGKKLNMDQQVPRLQMPSPNDSSPQDNTGAEEEITHKDVEVPIIEPQTPKLKSSWSFLEGDLEHKALDSEVTDTKAQTSATAPDVATEQQSHIFTIDSVSTLSDDDIDNQAPISESPPSMATDSNADDCFKPELLSEQDLSTVVLGAPGTPNRVPTPLGVPTDLSPASEHHLVVSDHSPAASLHSSTDLDELVVDDGAESEQNPIVVNRVVNEHGISTASPSLHFRSRTKSSMSASALSLPDSVTEEADVEKGISKLPERCEVDEAAVDKSTFALFKRMNSAAVKRYRMPEKGIQQWGAELIIAIGTLHSVGILCRNLNPDNILLTADGHIRLTYFSKWKQVEPRSASVSLPHGYCAPEAFDVSTKKTEACDWWCLGALLYELLIGKPLHEAHPCGVASHTILKYPDFLSEEAKSLLDGLLAYHPTQRLGYGARGLDDLMSHPFFKDVEWDRLVEEYDGR